MKGEDNIVWACHCVLELTVLRGFLGKFENALGMKE